MAKSADAPLCCDLPMGRVFTAPMVRQELTPFVSPVDGKTIISSRAQRSEYLKRNGLVCAADKGPSVTRPTESTLTKSHIASAVQKVQGGYKPAKPITMESFNS